MSPQGTASFFDNLQTDFSKKVGTLAFHTYVHILLSLTCCFFNFFLQLVATLDFPMRDRTFEAKSSAAVSLKFAVLFQF